MGTNRLMDPIGVIMPDTLITVKYTQPVILFGGSTDVGDVQHLLPVFTFNTGGASGSMHGSDFDITDEENAYLDAARGFAIYAYELLRNGAKLAHETVQNYKPIFPDKEAYTSYIEQFRCVQEILSA